VGYLLRPAKEKASAFAPIFKVAGLAVLTIGGLLLLTSSSGLLGGKGLSAESVDQVLQKNQQALQTFGPAAHGAGSNYTAPSPSPLLFPQDVVTVLFRPLPFEVHNVTGLVDSVEGLVLMGIVLQSRQRLYHIVRIVRRTPYVLVAVLYSAIFIYLFAAIGNLGVIAREKVQLLPFFLLLLAVPRPPMRDKWSGQLIPQHHKIT
jgi:hypothetical protein